MDKLDEILGYYRDNFGVVEDITEMKQQLIDNNVVVKDNSFFCPIQDESGYTVLLAGTTDKADMWVLKEIIKFIKTGDVFITVVNGNSDKILPMLEKYDCKILNRIDSSVYLIFNTRN